MFACSPAWYRSAAGEISLRVNFIVAAAIPSFSAACGARISFWVNLGVAYRQFCAFQSVIRLREQFLVCVLWWFIGGEAPFGLRRDTPPGRLFLGWLGREMSAPLSPLSQLAVP